MDRGLLQKELATLMGVCEDTVVGWELRETTPTIGQMPNIIRIIGYLPVDFDISTLGGRIRHYRHVNGVSQEELAKELGLNESTIFHYEKGTHTPMPKSLKKLEILLKGLEKVKHNNYRSNV